MLPIFKFRSISLLCQSNRFRLLESLKDAHWGHHGQALSQFSKYLNIRWRQGAQCPVRSDICRLLSHLPSLSSFHNACLGQVVSILIVFVFLDAVRSQLLTLLPLVRSPLWNRVAVHVRTIWYFRLFPLSTYMILWIDREPIWPSHSLLGPGRFDKDSRPFVSYSIFKKQTDEQTCQGGTFK